MECLGLSLKQSIAAELIGSGHSKKAAAEQVGVRPETVSYWMRNPEFRAAIHLAHELAIEDTRNQLTALAGKALGILNDLLDDNKSGTRLKAAGLVLNQHKTFKSERASQVVTESDGSTSAEVISRVDHRVQKNMLALEKYLSGMLDKEMTELVTGFSDITEEIANDYLDDINKMRAHAEVICAQETASAQFDNTGYKAALPFVIMCRSMGHMDDGCFESVMGFYPPPLEEAMEYANNPNLKLVLRVEQASS